MLGTVTSLEQLRFGPGGGIYRIVATSADTRNTHFAFEATEPPGGGPPLHIHTREEEYLPCSRGRDHVLDQRPGSQGERGWLSLRPARHAALLQEHVEPRRARARPLHAGEHRRLLRLRPGGGRDGAVGVGAAGAARGDGAEVRPRGDGALAALIGRLYSHGSILPQRDHRIDGSRAHGWNEAREHRGGQQQSGDD